MCNARKKTTDLNVENKNINVIRCLWCASWIWWKNDNNIHQQKKSGRSIENHYRRNWMCFSINEPKRNRRFDDSYHSSVETISRSNLIHSQCSTRGPISRILMKRMNALSSSSSSSSSKNNSTTTQKMLITINKVCCFHKYQPAHIY